MYQTCKGDNKTRTYGLYNEKWIDYYVHTKKRTKKVLSLRSSDTEQSLCFKCPRNFINAAFNTEHILFLITSFASVETHGFPQERVMFFPVFMVRMQSLYVCRQKACAYSGNLNLIYFGSMANNTVCVCVCVSI